MVIPDHSEIQMYLSWNGTLWSECCNRINAQQFTNGYKQECNILLLCSAATRINLKIWFKTEE